MNFRNKKTQATINNEWNSLAGEWDDLASSYRDIFIKVLWQQTGLEPNEKRVIVDFGCGTGLLTESLRRQSPHSDFICIDAAEQMVEVVEDKIRAGEWENVQAFCVTLAEHERASERIRNTLKSLHGKVDLITASSVLSFIPPQDLQATMKVLGTLLRPGGLLCHSDWMKSNEFPYGYSEEKAIQVYEMAGLKPKSAFHTCINMGLQEGKVFVGVAEKS